MISRTAFVVSLSATLAAQTPPSQHSIPRFRSGVELVTVDVSVTDLDGQPVGDLAVEDFAVEVGGSPRRVVSATFIPLGADARPSPSEAEAGAETAPASYTTNEGAVGGRLILFVVDRGNIRVGDGTRLFRQAGTFLDRLGTRRHDRACAGRLRDPCGRLGGRPRAGDRDASTADQRQVGLRLPPAPWPPPGC